MIPEKICWYKHEQEKKVIFGIRMKYLHKTSTQFVHYFQAHFRPLASCKSLLAEASARQRDSLWCVLLSGWNWRCWKCVQIPGKSLICLYCCLPTWKQFSYTVFHAIFSTHSQIRQPRRSSALIVSWLTDRGTFKITLWFFFLFITLLEHLINFIPFE